MHYILFYIVLINGSNTLQTYNKFYDNLHQCQVDSVYIKSPLGQVQSAYCVGVN